MVSGGMRWENIRSLYACEANVKHIQGLVLFVAEGISRKSLNIPVIEEKLSVLGSRVLISVCSCELSGNIQVISSPKGDEHDDLHIFI